MPKGRKQPSKPQTLAQIEARLACDNGHHQVSTMISRLPPDARAEIDVNPDARDSLICAITAALAERDPTNAHPVLNPEVSIRGKDAHVEGVIWLHDKAFDDRPAAR